MRPIFRDYVIWRKVGNTSHSQEIRPRNGLDTGSISVFNMAITKY